MNHQYNEPQKASPPHPFSVNACLRSSLLLAIGFTFHAHAAAPLADAVEQRDATAVRTLLADSAIDAPQPDGTTALHWAARHDDLAAAKSLLAAKANPNAQNRYGVTPLSLACTNGSAALVTALLDAGADANLALEIIESLKRS